KKKKKRKMRNSSLRAAASYGSGEEESGNEEVQEELLRERSRTVKILEKRDAEYSPHGFTRIDIIAKDWKQQLLRQRLPQKPPPRPAPIVHSETMGSMANGDEKQATANQYAMTGKAMNGKAMNGKAMNGKATNGKIIPKKPTPMPRQQHQPFVPLTSESSRKHDDRNSPLSRMKKTLIKLGSVAGGANDKRGQKHRPIQVPPMQVPRAITPTPSIADDIEATNWIENTRQQQQQNKKKEEKLKDEGNVYSKEGPLLTTLSNSAVSTHASPQLDYSSASSTDSPSSNSHGYHHPSYTSAPVTPSVANSVKPFHPSSSSTPSNVRQDVSSPSHGQVSSVVIPSTTTTTTTITSTTTTTTTTTTTANTNDITDHPESNSASIPTFRVSNFVYFALCVCVCNALLRLSKNINLTQLIGKEFGESIAKAQQNAQKDGDVLPSQPGKMQVHASDGQQYNKKDEEDEDVDNDDDDDDDDDEDEEDEDDDNEDDDEEEEEEEEEREEDDNKEEKEEKKNRDANSNASKTKPKTVQSVTNGETKENNLAIGTNKNEEKEKRNLLVANSMTKPTSTSTSTPTSTSTAAKSFQGLAIPTMPVATANNFSSLNKALRKQQKSEEKKQQGTIESNVPKVNKERDAQAVVNNNEEKSADTASEKNKLSLLESSRTELSPSPSIEKDIPATDYASTDLERHFHVTVTKPNDDDDDDDDYHQGNGVHPRRRLERPTAYVNVNYVAYTLLFIYLFNLTKTKQNKHIHIHIYIYTYTYVYVFFFFFFLDASYIESTQIDEGSEEWKQLELLRQQLRDEYGVLPYEHKAAENNDPSNCDSNKDSSLSNTREHKTNTDVNVNVNGNVNVNVNVNGNGNENSHSFSPSSFTNTTNENNLSSTLWTQIMKDVNRTLQYRSFFRKVSSKYSLGNVLYVWVRSRSRDNTYLQGMNELAAIITCAISYDYQQMLENKNLNPNAHLFNSTMFWMHFLKRKKKKKKQIKTKNML
ncbi:CCCH-type zinc finger-containing protein, partial [Reticulomyxa filosa]